MSWSERALAKLVPRCIVRQSPWCMASSLPDYCACLCLFFELSLCWSPFGPQSVITNDCQHLLSYFARCAKRGLLTFSSQPGLLNYRLQKSTLASHVNHREYLHFLIWKRQGVDVDCFITCLRNEGFLVTVDFENTKPAVLTEGKIANVWRTFLMAGAAGALTPDEKRRILDEMFCYSPPQLRAIECGETTIVFVYDPVLGRKILIRRVVEMAEEMFPLLPESYIYNLWKTEKPAFRTILTNT